VQPGDLSPDRLWRWDGARWVPAATAYAPPNLPAISSPLPQTTAARRHSWLAISAGLVAALGAIMIILGCALTYVHYTDSTDPSSLSVFNPGFGPSTWFAAEPVGVAAFTFAAAVVLMVSANRVARAMTAGVLVAYGAQTFLLFSGYVALAAGSQSAQIGPGGLVGMAAGVVIFASGLMAALSLFAGGRST
jgi:hypothetical protein